MIPVPYIFLFVLACKNVLISHIVSFIDNDKPIISTSKASPVENIDSVTMMCNAVTTDTGIAYAWFYMGTKDDGQTGKTFHIGNKRSSSGNYTCAVKTSVLTTPVESDVNNVLFLCKYSLFPIHSNSNVTLQ